MRTTMRIASRRASCAHEQGTALGRRGRLRVAAGALALLALCATYAAILAGRVGAQATRLASVDRALALAVAKVAANEASLARVRPAEVALIWQVTEARASTSASRLACASTSASRLAWLRAHSPCVLGDRDIRPGNCRWSRHLTDSDATPEGWPEHIAWSRYAPRWAQVRELARRLVSGRVVMRPCPGTPFTWGGPMDHERAIERGLVPLDCRDPQTGERTLNEGYALAPGGEES